MALAPLFLLLVVQDDARSLADKLRSESVVERDDAYRRLKEIGPPALDEIARAARDGDAEAARLANRLLKEGTPLLLALLEKGSPEDRQTAMEALDRLVERGAIPAIVRRLEDPVTRVRLAAASALCRLGVREGVSVLLDERANLTVLNALRTPEAWEKIRGARLRAHHVLTSPGSVKHDLLRWAGDFRLKARWEPGSPGDLYLWKSQLSFPSGRRRLSCEDATGGLEYYMDDGRFGAIVEADAIRVVPYDEAWVFWKKWADETRR